MTPLASKIDASFSTETQSKSSIMASIEAFKSAVVRIRDILRGPGVAITGMDSMRHICLYLLSRYMTKDKVKSLGVPDEFAWENLIETAQTKNGGVQKALDCFFHKETDCLVNHFDRLFGTENFSFDIKNPAKHKEMLEILDKVNMEQIDCQMDTLGWVYEQHLKTGSSAARDLGQFFTDRFICDYMVNLCKPGFKSKGVPESVCDPSMGTGGFLTSYMKFYKKHHADKSVDWSIQNKEIHGCDTDPKVAGVARLNLFMESGGNRAVNLRTHDSLYGDLTQTGYDLILANMPFGLKGIKHAECCERVNKLKIRGTKSEPLFLQLMMVSLNRGGRCAVVVPDGMLVNGSTCHDETRKYLLDNFELKRVIKMKGQFFMNTGIQPSILFFENTGKPTSVVEFWDVIKGANGDIEETMVLSVPRAKFDASCSFDMRRYQEVAAVLNTGGFPMVKLGDVVDFPKTIKKFNSGDRDPSGTVPFFNGKWSCPDGTHTDHSFESDSPYMVMIKDGGGDHSSDTVGMGKFFKMRGKCAITSHNMIVTLKPDNGLLYDFLYHYLSMNVKSIRDMATYSINLGAISKESIINYKIILPPLPIQQEIVTALDLIYNNAATAKAAATSVKSQMAAVVRSVGARGFERKKLGDICTFERSKIQASKTVEGNIPFISLKLGYHNESTLPHDQHVFISAIPQGNRKMKCHYHFGECSYSGLMFHCNLKKESIIPKFFYYWISQNMTLLDSYVIGIQPRFNHENFLNELISLPPLPIQHEVLAILNEMEAELQTLEQMAAKAEQRAKFILDGYLTPAPMPVAENVEATSSQAEEKPVKKRVFKVATGPV